MTLKDAIQKYFRRKTATPTPQQEGQGVEPVPLRIEGVKPAPLTAEPDDAELAAQALLESLSPDPSPVERGGTAADKDIPLQGGQRGAAYYHALADRIRTARTAEARLVMRLLASVEEKLSEPTSFYRGQLGDTERKLYRAMDVAEREGGELHRRWQHCLANVLVRRMEEERENELSTKREQSQTSLNSAERAESRPEGQERRMKNEELSELRESPDETPPQNPTEGRTTNPTEGRLAMPTEGRPADTTLETSSQTVLPVTEAAINQP